MKTVIQTSRLTKKFRDAEVLRGVDFAVEQGQIIGLLGTNGAGKTTLIKCLLGLLKRTTGESSIFEDDSWNLSAEVKSRLGYVSQDFVLTPWMTVQGMANYTGSFYEKWDQPFVENLIREWDLDPDKSISTLSTGQRQKLAVILSLGHHPDLLILDEPVASLDPMARRQFLQSIIEFTEREERTVLFSTHITSDLERIASHVAMLKDGRIQHFGELDTLKHQVKRVRLRSESSLPNDLVIPGALWCELNGPQAVAAVSDWEPSKADALRSKYRVEVSVEDLNLEEIFLELNETQHRGVSS